ncbi:MAG: hypothetical protein QOI71_3816 [Gaiellales bacterium]|jgi:uncharacterized protein (TIGR02271 family)|nr:hypothetical protein [Gaiellales bacterium]
MTNTLDPRQLTGTTAVDANGTKIGSVEQVYLSDQTREPEWVTVRTGMFGNKQSFAPLQGARLNGGELVLRVSKDLVKDAPNIDDDGHLDEAENDRLYEYYSGYADTAGYETTGGDYQETARDSGRDSDGAMTRSEERLEIGTEKVPAGRARLRKYIVTENVTQTVPVSREEVRLEREPVTDNNRDDALQGPDLSEAEHEVTLHAEQPVVDKRVEPVERVRLAKETVTEEQQVSDEVRHEEIDVEGDEGNRSVKR